jgi:SAM-dependent methyltransferase
LATRRFTSSVGVGTIPVREARTSSAWVREHLDAAAEVVDFLAGDGITLAGAAIADVGCGDGIIDLGVALKADPARLVGFDIVPTDVPALIELARREGIADELPEGLEFRRSEPRALPAEEDSFDIVFSWSTFEHVTEPTALLRDIRRVLRPQGTLMIQVWPFFHSQHGSHLWQYFPAGFVQLLRSQEQIEAEVRADPGPDPEWAERLLDEARSCNRITLDGLQAALLDAGFVVGKLELLTEPVHLPEGVERVPLSLLGVSGAKLLASPRLAA